MLCVGRKCPCNFTFPWFRQRNVCVCMCGFFSKAKINSLCFSGKFAGAFEKRKIYAYIVSGLYLSVFHLKYTKKLLGQTVG